MSTITKEFTKEQLIEKLQHRIAVTANYPDVEEAQFDAAIFKIALASLEAKPVAAAYVINGVIEADDFASYCGHPKFQDGPIELYAAPHATVSVPDFGALTKCIVQRLVDYGAADDDAIASAEEFVYNACRAAMFQGGKP